MKSPGIFESAVSAVTDVVRSFFEDVGRIVMLLGQTLVWLLRRPFRGKEFVRQLDFVGVQSVFLMVLTGAFTGMVMALQSYNGLNRYGAQSIVGAMVALAMARELGPVLAALMIAGRVGSAMTAELGSMRNTQQIDALSGMAVEPIQYLVVPRVVASTVVLPVLAAIFSISGMVGAYVISVGYLKVDAGTFMSGIKYYLEPSDVTQGLIKALVFGLIVSLVACYKGFYVTGGARGVGMSTTKSVVVSSVLVLISDYIMTTLMFGSS